jgi:hypothetical protein
MKTMKSILAAHVTADATLTKRTRTMKSVLAAHVTADATMTTITTTMTTARDAAAVDTLIRWMTQGWRWCSR